MATKYLASSPAPDELSPPKMSQVGYRYTQFPTDETIFNCQK